MLFCALDIVYHYKTINLSSFISSNCVVSRKTLIFVITTFFQITPYYCQYEKKVWEMLAKYKEINLIRYGKDWRANM